MGQTMDNNCKTAFSLQWSCQRSDNYMTMASPGVKHATSQSTWQRRRQVSNMRHLSQRDDGVARCQTCDVSVNVTTASPGVKHATSQSTWQRRRQVSNMRHLSLKSNMCTAYVNNSTVHYNRPEFHDNMGDGWDSGWVTSWDMTHYSE